MTRPNRYLLRMLIFLVIVLIVAVLLYAPIIRAFAANYLLNGLILTALIIGIVYNFRQVLKLRPEVEWIETFRRAEPGLSVQRPPVMLAPMAALFGDHQGRVTLSTVAMRTLLDTIGSRLDERRDISRYLIGLLVFLGLLGTFWGLLETISSVGDTIRGLSPAAQDFGAFFDELKAGLEAPLDGMGVAFSSSLFGLSGSLILGFLDLQSGQAQNRFYNDLEEWLSQHTRLGGGTGISDGEQSIPAYVEALLEQTAESLDNLQRTLARMEEGRASGQHALNDLAERLAVLGDAIRNDQQMTAKMLEQQVALRPILEHLAQGGAGAAGLDEASRNHLRNLDAYVMRLLEEMNEGRHQLITEMRGEVKLLARTIAAASESQRRL